MDLSSTDEPPPPGRRPQPRHGTGDAAAGFSAWLETRHLPRARRRQILDHVRHYLDWRARTPTGRDAALADDDTMVWCYLQHLHSRRTRRDELAAWAALEVFVDYCRSSPGDTRPKLQIPAPRPGRNPVVWVWTCTPPPCSGD